MRIYTNAISFSLTKAISEHVKEKISAALKTLESSVISATVRLDDVNGKRGGIDKRCRVVVELRGTRVIASEAISNDLYAAVSKAANRAKRAALKAIKKQKANERKDAQRPGSFGESLVHGPTTAVAAG